MFRKPSPIAEHPAVIEEPVAKPVVAEVPKPAMIEPYLVVADKPVAQPVVAEAEPPSVVEPAAAMSVAQPVVTEVAKPTIVLPTVVFPVAQSVSTHVSPPVSPSISSSASPISGRFSRLKQHQAGAMKKTVSPAANPAARINSEKWDVVELWKRRKHGRLQKMALEKMIPILYARSRVDLISLVSCWARHAKVKAELNAARVLKYCLVGLKSRKLFSVDTFGEMQMAAFKDCAAIHCLSVLGMEESELEWKCRVLRMAQDEAVVDIQAAVIGHAVRESIGVGHIAINKNLQVEKRVQREELGQKGAEQKRRSSMDYRLSLELYQRRCQALLKENTELKATIGHGMRSPAKNEASVVDTVKNQNISQVGGGDRVVDENERNFEDERLWDELTKGANQVHSARVVQGAQVEYQVRKMWKTQKDIALHEAITPSRESYRDASSDEEMRRLDELVQIGRAAARRSRGALARKQVSPAERDTGDSNLGKTD